MNLSQWLGTKLRTGMQTMLVCCLVQNGMAQSTTGALHLTTNDAIALPCTQRESAQWTFCAWPAPFGETQITNIMVCWYPAKLNTLFAIGGMATSEWMDLTTTASRAWNVTDQFMCGVRGRVHAWGARGFQTTFDAGIDVQSSVRLDSSWMFGISVRELLGIENAGLPLMRTLQVGIAYTGSVTLALDVISGFKSDAGIQLAALIPFHQQVTSRLRILTEPLSAAIDTQVDVGDVLITLLVEHIVAVGSSLGLVIELPITE